MLEMLINVCRARLNMTFASRSFTRNIPAPYQDPTIHTLRAWVLAAHGVASVFGAAVSALPPRACRCAEAFRRRCVARRRRVTCIAADAVASAAEGRQHALRTVRTLRRPVVP